MGWHKIEKPELVTKADLERLEAGMIDLVSALGVATSRVTEATDKMLEAMKASNYETTKELNRLRAERRYIRPH